METRLDSFACLPVEEPWFASEAPPLVSAASVMAAGGTSSAQSGAEGAGGTSSAAAPHQRDARGACENAVLEAMADCTVALASRRRPDGAPSTLVCAVSVNAAVDCLVDQYLQAQRSR